MELMLFGRNEHCLCPMDGLITIHPSKLRPYNQTCRCYFKKFFSK